MLRLIIKIKIEHVPHKECQNSSFFDVRFRSISDLEQNNLHPSFRSVGDGFFSRSICLPLTRPFKRDINIETRKTICFSIVSSLVLFPVVPFFVSFMGKLVLNTPSKLRGLFYPKLMLGKSNCKNEKTNSVVPS